MTSQSVERGFSLPEILVVSFLLGLVALVVMGSTERLLEQSSTWSLNQVVRGLVGQAAGRAVMERTYIAVAFEEGEGGANARLYADGDGDGVTREDIGRGVDRPLGAPVFLHEGRAYLGLPEAVKTDPAGKVLTGRDPIRFGRGSILSFSPNGTSTPGSLYLRAMSGKEAWAFRVAGIDGRIRTYRWWKGSWSEVK
jgi:prepilin-type N-terminal cleavage/methylation domain-containing protein